MKKVGLFFTLVFIFSLTTFQPLNAQYGTGIGLRAGWASGLSVKHFIIETNALEFLATSRWDGFILTCLYEWQNEIKVSTLHTTQLSWYIGFGAHIGTFKAGGKYKDPDHESYDDDVIAVGIDAIIGLEYEFIQVPFSVSLDLKPNYSFTNPTNDFLDGALTIRYVLGRR